MKRLKNIEKVIIVHPFLDVYGGAERKVLLLAQFLERKKINVVIYTFKHNKNNCFPELSKKLKIISFKFIKIKFLWLIYMNFLLFINCFNKNNQVILSNSPAQFCLFLISIIRIKWNNKPIWICNEVHDSSFQKNIYNFLKYKLNFKLAKNFKIISNSICTYKNVKRIYQMNSTIAYPAIINYGFNLKKNYKRNFFLYFGRIEHGKNIDFLLKLVRIFPEEKFVIIGNGDEAYKVISLTKKLKNLEYFKYVSESKKSYFFSNAKCLLFPAHNEPFGVVLIESLYFGTPVVSFKSGGPLEIIKNNKFGYLAKSELDYIRYVSNFKIHQYKQNVLHEYVKNKYSLTNMVTKILC